MYIFTVSNSPTFLSIIRLPLRKPLPFIGSRSRQTEQTHIRGILTPIALDPQIDDHLPFNDGHGGYDPFASIDRNENSQWRHVICLYTILHFTPEGLKARIYWSARQRLEKRKQVFLPILDRLISCPSRSFAWRISERLPLQRRRRRVC